MSPTGAAGVELTGLRAPSSGAEVDAVTGEENDDVPLLLHDERRTQQESSPLSSCGLAGAADVHPLPNSSYTRDGLSWASKLVFSWINPVLDKVRGPTKVPLRLLVQRQFDVLVPYSSCACGDSSSHYLQQQQATPAPALAMRAFSNHRCFHSSFLSITTNIG